MEVARLLNCELFSGIQQDDLSSVLSCLDARTKHFAKGDFILKAGTTLADVGIVMEGCVHLIQEDYWGNRVLIEQLGPCEVFGEAFACAPNVSLPLSVIAAKDTTVLFVDYKRIITVCPSACIFHLNLIRNMVSSMAQKNIILTRKIEHTTKRSIHDKILSYLSTQAIVNESSSFEIPFSRQELADYLAVDRASLSRSLSNMREQGIIKISGRKVTLLDRAEY